MEPTTGYHITGGSNAARRASGSPGAGRLGDFWALFGPVRGFNPSGHTRKQCCVARLTHSLDCGHVAPGWWTGGRKGNGAGAILADDEPLEIVQFVFHGLPPAEIAVRGYARLAEQCNQPLLEGACEVEGDAGLR